MSTASVSRPLLAVALTLAAASGLASCGKDKATGSSPTSTTPIELNTQTVAGAIKQSIKQQRGIRAHVVCPKSITQQQGNDFVCQASTKDGTVTQFAVQQTDNAGHVTYAAAESAASTPATSTTP